jgi:mycothiol synthase
MPDLVMLVAEDADGRIVGYGDLTDQALEHRRFFVDLRILPTESGREVGSALLDVLEARSAEPALPDATIRLFLPSTHEPAARLAHERGYEPFRHSFQMRIEFDGELPEPEWPDGLSVRTFVAGRDDEAVHAAHQESFSDHFEHAHWPYESWRQWAFIESFDPTLWWVAEDGDDIAGVCLARIEGYAGPDLGWIHVLGVRRPWRRRGLGRALLLHAFSELRTRGKRGVGLGVDGLNTTGAVRLYENAGMHVARRFDQFKKPLRA